MARNRTKKEDTPIDSSWALSYGDMMTLLLTFFILIVSFSTVELIKFKQAMGSLRGSMGVLLEQSGSDVVKQESSVMDRPIMQRETMLNALQQIEAQVFEMDAGSGIDIEVSDEGVNFRIKDDLLFPSGGTHINPDMKDMLGKVGNLIKAFKSEVRVEGHSDSMPISSGAFASNWELSTMRAVNVVEYFIDEAGIDPARLVAMGVGANRPVAPNDTPENRAKNRRVEIFLNWNNIKDVSP
jgi:chemotaxis protein MotB